MALTTTSNKVSYSGDGTTTVFNFPFRVDKDTDLQVTLYDSAGTATVQTLNTDYTITGLGVDSGGSITMTTAPATGTTLLLYREVAYTQETTFTEGEAFPIKTIESDLDKLTMETQQLKEVADRSLQFKKTDSTSSVELPVIQTDAYLGTDTSKKLVWKGHGAWTQTNADFAANSVPDLIAIDTSSYTSTKVTANLLGYHDAGDGGGGLFYWDANKSQDEHNGGTIIAPSVTFPSDWTNQSQLSSWFLDKWQASTVYNAGDLRAPTTANGAYFKCITGGTSGTTEPTWDTVDGHNTTDGTVVWTAINQTGCWIRQYDGDVNIKWFGAKVDKTTDDTKAIQKVLNTFNVIEGSDGTSLISKNLDVDSNTYFDGLNVFTLQQNVDNINILDIINRNNVTITNIKFLGYGLDSSYIGFGANNIAIKVENGDNINIIGNDISGFSNDGIFADGLTNSYIKHNHIYNIGKRNTATNTPISSTNFVSGSYSCLFVGYNNNSSNITISKNILHGCLNTILSVINTSNSKIIENYVYDGDSNGIQFGTGCLRINCNKNIVTSLTGLYNPPTEGVGIGIKQGSDNSIIRENIITNCQVMGINTQSANNCSIISNVLDSCNMLGSRGSVLGWGDNLIIKDNTIKNDFFEGIDISPVNSIIENNTVHKSTSAVDQTGIRVSTTYNANCGYNKIHKNIAVTQGILLSVLGEEQEVINNSGFAIYTSGTSNIYVFDNDIIKYVSDTYGFKTTNTGGTVFLKKKTNSSTYNDNTTSPGKLITLDEGITAYKKIVGNALMLSGNTTVNISFNNILTTYPTTIVANAKNYDIGNIFITNVTTTGCNLSVTNPVSQDTYIYYIVYGN